MQLNKRAAAAPSSSSSTTAAVREAAVVTPTKQYTGSIHASRSIIKNFGMQALYIGHGVNTLREVIFLSTYFTVYEASKKSLLSLPSLSSAIAIPLGLVARIISCILEIVPILRCFVRTIE